MSAPIDDIFEDGAKPVDPAPDGTRKGFVAEDPKGKFLILGVDDYDGTGASSYLRLGAAAKAAGQLGPPTATGEDLAALVQGFTDDGRDRDGDTPAPAETLMSGLAEGSPIGPADRVNESGSPLPSSSTSFLRLHQKGGWRDHTDGNRISTTRGDKVEVVRGNYKLLVLGRQSTKGIDADAGARRTLIGNSAGVEMSGGVLDTDSSDLAYPDNGGAALDVEYTWDQDSDGAWGWTQTTTVGSESPSGSPTNYRVLSQTWVDYQDTNIGAGDRSVSSVSQETYATAMSTLVDVDGTNSTTTTSALELFTTTDAAVLHDVVTAKISTELRAILESGEADLSLLIAVAQVAQAISNLSIGTVLDDKTALHSDIHLGVHLDNHAGVHVEDGIGVHADTHYGPHSDLHYGIHVDQHYGIHASIDQTPIEIKDGTIKVAGQTFESREAFNASTVGSKYKAVVGAAFDLANTYHIKM